MLCSLLEPRRKTAFALLCGSHVFDNPDNLYGIGLVGSVTRPVIKGVEHFVADFDRKISSHDTTDQLRNIGLLDFGKHDFSAPEWIRYWHFKTEADGQISIGCEEISFDFKVLTLIEADCHTQKELVEILKVDRVTVWRWGATRWFIKGGFKPCSFIEWIVSWEFGNFDDPGRRILPFGVPAHPAANSVSAA